MDADRCFPGGALDDEWECWSDSTQTRQPTTNIHSDNVRTAGFSDKTASAAGWPLQYEMHAKNDGCAIELEEIDTNIFKTNYAALLFDPVPILCCSIK